MPAQIGPSFVALVSDGAGFTETDVVYTVDGLQPGWPLPSLTVSEYTLVTVGVAVGLAAEAEANDKPNQT